MFSPYEWLAIIGFFVVVLIGLYLIFHRDNSDDDFNRLLKSSGGGGGSDSVGAGVPLPPTSDPGNAQVEKSLEEAVRR